MSTDGEISQREYWAQVEAIAKDVTEEAVGRGDEISDLLHEAIDSHSWIIYTWKAQQVMQWTDNADAIADVGCEFADKSWAEIVGQFAYYALYQDVCEHSAFGADPAEPDDH